MAEGLFDFIKSLSQGEKRYFSNRLKDAGSGEKTGLHIRLYHLLSGMRSYDRIKVKEFRRKSSNFSVVKRNLEEAILKYMREYRARKSEGSKIRALIMDAHFLREKARPEAAFAKLMKAKDLARSFDHQTSLLEIGVLERYLNFSLQKEPGEEDFYLKQDQGLLKALSDKHKYFGYYSLVMNRKRKAENYTEGSPAAKALRRSVPASEFDLQNLPSSASGQRNFYLAAVHYHQILCDDESTHHFSKALLGWWDAHPEQKVANLKGYIIDLSNYINFCLSVDLPQLVEPLLDKFENIEVRNDYDKSILFEKKYYNRLFFYLDQERIREAKRTIKKIEEELLPLQTVNLRLRLGLFFNIASLYFQAKEFESCLEWCEKLMKVKYEATRQGAQIPIRWLYLVGFHEIFPDVFTREYRSVRRYFRKFYGKEESPADFRFLFLLQKIHHALPADQRVYKNQMVDFLTKHKGKLPGHYGVDKLVCTWAAQ